MRWKQLTLAVCTFASALAFAFASTTPLMAQAASPFVGTWKIQYEAGRRMENGEVTPIMGEGTLTVVAQGDSLVATLLAGPRPDGTPSRPTRMAGVAGKAPLVLTSLQQVRINENGEVSTRNLTLTWTLTASGDQLSGSLARSLGAEADPSPSAVTGKRAL